jgi:type VI secretion system lysozyme-like protein
VREPGVIRGARAPLFERLSDKDPGAVEEVRPLRILDRHELRTSVLQEVARILNTRRHAGDQIGDGMGLTVLDYGVPDFASFGSGEEARLRLAAVLSEAIRSFEPRLREVRVWFEQDPRNPNRLIGGMEASLATETVHEPVYFPLLIHARADGGGLEIAGSPDAVQL